MQSRLLALLLILPTTSFAQPPEAREREEIIEIFSEVVPKMDVRSGDGLGSDFECVFSNQWDHFSAKTSSDKSATQSGLHELLTIQQAIDPLDKKTNMFCDYRTRDAQAQQLADEGNKRISVARVEFSYPNFSTDLQKATVYYQPWSKVFLPSTVKKDLPAGTFGEIKLDKRREKWSFEFIVNGIAD